MPQVICPQCGTANDTRAPDYPFCVGCQDNLAKCGYCRWFHAGAGACTHPVVAGVFQVGESATPPCVHHTPNERVLGRRRFLQVTIWATAVLVVAAVAWGLFGLRPPEPVPALPAVAKLELGIQADYEGRQVGEPFTVVAFVYNTGDRPADRVRLEISRQSLQAFKLFSVSPEPAMLMPQGVWEMLFYPEVGARQRLRIAITLIPRQSGNQHLTVRLVSGDNMFHGVLDVPIVVERRPSSAGAQAPARREQL